MQIGMIGLGRMGANMVRRLMEGGHACVVHDRSADAIRRLAAEGASTTAESGLMAAYAGRVLAAALYQRFSSRAGSDYQDRLLSAMRFAFGGHAEQGPPA